MNVQCGICPKRCVIGPGESGDCRIRVNVDGRLTAVTWGFPCSVHVDPVEKKPLFHFRPGTSIFSLATVGCNLHCKNCQNWEISQRNPEDSEAVALDAAAVPALAHSYGCESVAYTYTDPVAFYEYALDCSIRSREAGLKNVLVTAGYINDRPWRELCRYTDAANINLKAYSDRFYRDICDASLQPVLDALVTAKSMGVMVEVTNLVIPTLNDTDGDLQALARWVKESMGTETPLHFIRFHPQHLMRHLPPTPVATLKRARDIAKAEGLDFVYIGNVTTEGGENTVCPDCGGLLVARRIHHVLENRIRGGACPACGKKIYGLW